jgi:hypothetical protein
MVLILGEMMRKNNKGNLLDGLVVDNDDPQQMGRLKVWVPSLDGDDYNIENLPWTFYLSPIASQTLDFKAAETQSQTNGYKSYGFWAIPKIGTIVVIGLLHNDSNLRFYIGSIFGEHGNRSLPNGRNRPDITPGPLSDTYEPIQPAIDNLKMQFQNNLTASEAITRGVYERAVAQDKTLKDGSEGYDISPSNKEKLEPQTYCLVTPGLHSLVFQDNPKNCRVRVKSASGHQIILDDANERIYISTARGNNYIELDGDGRIHIYANNDVSMNVGGDLNFSATGNFNVNANNVNIAARADTKISSCGSFHVNAGSELNLTSSKDTNFKVGQNFVLSSSKMLLNGSSKAAEAVCADVPSVVPAHEPWVRPNSKIKRNKNWRA